MSKILPEKHHKFQALTMEQIKKAHETNTTVTGFVERIYPEHQSVKVSLGKKLYAFMPFSEATIYPFRYSQKHPNSKIPANIHELLKHKIRVKVVNVDGERIIVSRRKNMIEAYNSLQSGNKLAMAITQVIPKTAFGDIGEGIIGKIYINNVTTTHIRSVSEYLKAKDTVDVIFQSFDENGLANISYKDAFKPYSKEDYPEGTTIQVTVREWLRVTDTSAYYVTVTPQVTGIMYVDHHAHFDYGTKVLCKVKGAIDKGLVLEFDKLL